MSNAKAMKDGGKTKKKRRKKKKSTPKYKDKGSIFGVQGGQVTFLLTKTI